MWYGTVGTVGTLDKVRLVRLPTVPTVPTVPVNRTTVPYQIKGGQGGGVLDVPKTIYQRVNVCCWPRGAIPQQLQQGGCPPYR